MTKLPFPKISVLLAMFMPVLFAPLPLIAAEGSASASAGATIGQEESAKPETQKESTSVEDTKIVIKTNKGDIHVTLFSSKVPVTTANFLNLAQHGYYDGITFHRVISDFMVQGGDPTGTGRGGPGYTFADEFDKSLRHSKPGILSMANAGPGTNGSQFFITHGPTPHLDGKHSVFGEVTKGQDVVDAIRQGDKIESIKIEGDTSDLFAAQKANIDKWDATLKREGHLK